LPRRETSFKKTSFYWSRSFCSNHSAAFLILKETGLAAAEEMLAGTMLKRYQWLWSGIPSFSGSLIASEKWAKKENSYWQRRGATRILWQQKKAVWSISRYVHDKLLLLLSLWFYWRKSEARRTAANNYQLKLTKQSKRVPGICFVLNIHDGFFGGTTTRTNTMRISKGNKHDLLIRQN
jgi:hypothetical protein